MSRVPTSGEPGVLESYATFLAKEGENVDISCSIKRGVALSAALSIIVLTGVMGACSAPLDSRSPSGAGGAHSGSSSSNSSTGGSSEPVLDLDGGGCATGPMCSNDLASVVDCKGQILTACSAEEGCANGKCVPDPCKAAETSRSSYGCDYWALKTALRQQADGACFAAFVTNTWSRPVHIKVEREGQALPDGFIYVPISQGMTVDYAPYDPVGGLPVGQVAILFLARSPFGGSVVDCPRPAAIGNEVGVSGTGLGEAFHITTDYPVVSYQIVPFGGAQSYVTSATLLLPTSAWDTNYVAVNAYTSAGSDYEGGDPSLNIVAHEDGTTVTILPARDIKGSADVAPATAGAPTTYKLDKGQYLQITQPEELTGSPIQSDKPVAVFGGSACMAVPTGKLDCDSAQQQIAPVRALGSTYAAVRYKDRVPGMPESPPYRLVGAVDGTELTWIPTTPPGMPKTVGLGQVIEFTPDGDFVVQSQDAEHPFYLGGYMTGGDAYNGVGDPEWVNIIPPAQYLDHYVFFTDPTYPETSLVVIRAPSRIDGSFADVELACAGKLGGWQKLGEYEYTRVDLVTGDFEGVGGCTNGRQEMASALPFGVTVWGWGTTQQTKLVSYAYPAGAGFQPINEVVVPVVPK